MRNFTMVTSHTDANACHTSTHSTNLLTAVSKYFLNIASTLILCVGEPTG